MMIFLLSHPAIIYHCDLTKDPLQPHIFREVTVKGFDPSDYQTTQVRIMDGGRMSLFFRIFVFLFVHALSVILKGNLSSA